MEKVKPTIIESKGMSFEELIIAYEKQCNMWNELKDYLLRFENIPVQVQSFKTVFELMKEIERIEKENDE